MPPGAGGVRRPAPAAGRWPWTGDTFLVLRWQEWPQGAVLFTLGVRWGERGWRGRVPAAWSHRCGQVAAAGLTAVGLLVAVTSLADEELGPLLGGWSHVGHLS